MIPSSAHPIRRPPPATITSSTTSTMAFLPSFHSTPLQFPSLSSTSKPPSPLPLRSSLYLSSQTQPPAPPSPSPSPTQKTPSIWVNPNSATATQRARISRFASSLSTSPPSLLPSLLSSSPHIPESDLPLLLSLLSSPCPLLPLVSHLLSSPPLRDPLRLFNLALKSARRLLHWPSAESLLQDLLRRGLKPDNVTFSTAVSCALSCGLPDRASHWFDLMPSLGVRPDPITFSTMIRAHGRSSRPDLALSLYNRARDLRLPLDVAAFSAVIRIHSSSGDFDGALNVFQEMKALRVPPNVVLYNTLLVSMGLAGRPWQAKSIFLEMPSSGIAPNYGSYAALLRAYARARHATDALATYREMWGKGMRPDVLLYNALLAMCANMHLPDEAAAIFDDMCTCCAPNDWTFSSLISAYACCGRVAETEAALERMAAAGIRPSLLVLTSLVQCYGKAGRTEKVVAVCGRLAELGIPPDDRFCGCLLDVMRRTPTEGLGKVLGCLESADARLGLFARRLIDEDTGDDTLREETKRVLVNAREEVRKPYCNCLIDLCVNLDLMERACVLLDLALELGVYGSIQSRCPTQWSLHVRSLSRGAALTALQAWVNDLSRAVDAREDMPPVLGINTGHGRHHDERGLAAMFQVQLRDMNAPFHELKDKGGWFLTTKEAVESWLRSRESTTFVGS